MDSPQFRQQEDSLLGSLGRSRARVGRPIDVHSWRQPAGSARAGFRPAPLGDDCTQTRLRLVDSRSTHAGVVIATYEPA
jgi:hypothetical protein